MDADRWQRISRLCHEALERPADQRDAFLDTSCQGDSALRAEVASLLAHEASTEASLAAPAAQEVADALTRNTEALHVGLEPGVRLGTYQVERRLGRGGMGVVFLAHDATLHRKVALKVLASPAGDGTARDRLLREARNAAALNHPNICTIYEVGEADGRAFIAMEYVAGRPLSERLAEAALSLAEVLRYGVEAADALAYAHDHGVIHRDLKAANAIVMTTGRLKLVDFGLARREDALLGDATTMPSLVSAGVAAGTPYAMAPEQVRGGVTDTRTDIWALGVLLYEMVAGAKPFTASTIPELFSSILRDAPAPLPNGVSTELQMVIERCLEREPDRRYQRADEVRAALEAIQAGATHAWGLWRARIGQRPWLPVAASALAIATLLVGGNVGGVRDRLTGSPPTAGPIKLAVLPFENLTGDPEQEYFSDGLTEEMIMQLGRLQPQRLSVIARTSSMKYKNRDVPIDQIGRELGVDYVLEGSARREGSRVRISATLIQVRNQTRQWADSFDRELAGILALQSDVARSVAGSLKLALLPVEQTRLASARSVNAEAYEAYLKGRFHWLKQTRADFDMAERYFQTALDKDPGYALGYAGLASVWMMRGDAGFQPSRETFPKASALIAKALELDTELAELYVQLANQKVVTEWDWPGAEREFQRAIEVNPNLADAHFFYADLLLAQKRPQEWSREIQRALELDPLNEFQRTYYGWQLNYQRRYDEAIPIFQKLLSTGPNKAANYLGLWGAYYRKGMFPEAAAAAREYFVSAGDGEFADALGAGLDEKQYRDGMTRTADAMVAGSKRRHVPAIRIARMFAHAADHDSALDWLERAYENHESPMSRLAVVWDWQDLHAEPRFQGLLRRMKLPQ